MIRPVVSYIQDSIEELRHVAWPTRREVIRYTATIIVSVAIAMLIVAVLDYLLGLAVDRFIIH